MQRLFSSAHSSTSQTVLSDTPFLSMTVDFDRTMTLNQTNEYFRALFGCVMQCLIEIHRRKKNNEEPLTEDNWLQSVNFDAVDPDNKINFFYADYKAIEDRYNRELKNPETINKNIEEKDRANRLDALVECLVETMKNDMDGQYQVNERLAIVALMSFLSDEDLDQLILKNENLMKGIAPRADAKVFNDFSEDLLGNKKGAVTVVTHNPYGYFLNYYFRKILKIDAKYVESKNETLKFGYTLALTELTGDWKFGLPKEKKDCWTKLIDDLLGPVSTISSSSNELKDEKSSMVISTIDSSTKEIKPEVKPEIKQVEEIKQIGEVKQAAVTAPNVIRFIYDILPDQKLDETTYREQIDKRKTQIIEAQTRMQQEFKLEKERCIGVHVDDNEDNNKAVSKIVDAVIQVRDKDSFKDIMANTNKKVNDCKARRQPKTTTETDNTEGVPLTLQVSMQGQ